ncbi:hypothetical protein TWF694_008823 [Orbilia ellipsospora]|uniref:Peptidase S8/S53 domain-containing protein n=1 Tax=Orbilia ellipsospora TaxID=2528407 RepID=A0AAV9XD19_9PEZI
MASEVSAKDIRTSLKTSSLSSSRKPTAILSRKPNQLLTTHQTPSHIPTTTHKPVPKKTPDPDPAVELIETPDSQNTNTIEPFIFLLKETARRDTNAQKSLENDLNGLGKKSQYDYVLRSPNVGTYFYTRNMTLSDARSFAERNKRNILIAARYLQFINDINRTTSLSITSSQSQTQTPGSPTKITTPIQNTTQPSVVVITSTRPFSSNPATTHKAEHPNQASKRDLKSENTDFLDIRILCQAPNETLPTQYRYDSNDGYGVHIYAVGTGANINHEAFQSALNYSQFDPPIYAQPNPAPENAGDGDTERFDGTGTLGKLVANKTGLARRSDITVVRAIDNESREGKPLLLSALVQLYDQVAPRGNTTEKFIISLSRSLQSFSSKSPLSERTLSFWLEEIMNLFGRLQNVILVAEAGDSRVCGDELYPSFLNSMINDSCKLKGSLWPASMKNISNLVTVGGTDSNGLKVPPSVDALVYAPATNISVPIMGPQGVNKQYGFRGGNSYGVTIVAGILAGYLSKYAGLSTMDVVELLKANSHIRNKTKEGVPIVWNGEAKKSLHHGPPVQSNGIKNPSPPSSEGACTTITSSDGTSIECEIPSPHPTTPTPPITPKPIAPGPPKPGIIYSTRYKQVVIITPEPNRVATVTEDWGKTTFTEVWVTPVEAVSTVTVTQTVLQYKAPPAGPPPPFFKTCYGLERGAYFQRDLLANFIESNFCADLVNNIPNDQFYCTKDKYWELDGNYWRSDDDWKDDGKIHNTCAWVWPAFGGSLGEVQVGVRWDHPGLRPSKHVCLRMFRSLVDGCDEDPVGNPLDYKGGGRIDSSDGLVHYWLEPQRHRSMMRKPFPPQDKFVACSHIEEKGKVSDFSIPETYLCEGWGWGETEGADVPTGAVENLWHEIVLSHKCSGASFSSTLAVLWSNNITDRREWTLIFTLDGGQKDCVAHSIRDASSDRFGIEVATQNILKLNKPLDDSAFPPYFTPDAGSYGN